MWEPALKRVPIRWLGSEPTPDAFGPSIVKTGLLIQTRDTRSYLERGRRIGRASFRPQRAEEASNSILSNKREAVSLRWRRRGSAWRRSARRAGEGVAKCAGRWRFVVGTMRTMDEPRLPTKDVRIIL